MEVFCIGVDPLGAAHVRGCKGEGVLVLALEFLEDVKEVVAGIEVIHGHVEEALDLVCVEVAGHDGVCAGNLEHVCHKLCADGGTGLVLAVLACPAIIRNHCNNSVGGCPFGGIYGQEQFHKVVRAGEGGLNDKTCGSAHTLLEIRLEFAVTETGCLQRA